MTDIIVANDIGTYQVKSIVLPRARPGKTNREMFEAVLGEQVDLLSPDPGLMDITTTEGKWFLGESARTYSRNPIWGRGLRWNLEEAYRALHLYAIARQVGISTRLVDVDLISALPSADYKNKDLIAEGLRGTHIIVQANRARPLTININNVFFGIQGWAALMAEGIPKGKGVAWLGLGGRNKTYATIDARGKILPEKTGSTEGGMLSVISDLIDRIKKEFYIELTEHEAIEALKNKRLEVATPIDISEQSREACEPYLVATKRMIEAKWNEQNDMPWISDFRIGGGGALELGTQIAEMHKQMRVVDDPLWSEALGLLNMGRAKWLNDA